MKLYAILIIAFVLLYLSSFIMVRHLYRVRSNDFDPTMYQCLFKEWSTKDQLLYVVFYPLGQLDGNITGCEWDMLVPID
jgi:hypothetical protein